MANATDNIRKVRPLADVFESENEYKIALDLAGVTREQIALNLEQETLKVSARRDSTACESIAFEREFSVSSVIDRERVSADYTAGVLTVTLPKHTSAKPRRIPVALG
jgi:HSP20 family protein